MVSPIDPFGVGVPELPGDPPERFTQLEHERREGAPRLVQRTGPRFCATERRAPHALTEVGDIEWPTVPVGKDPRTVSFARVAMGAERLLDDREHRENNPARLEAVG